MPSRNLMPILFPKSQTNDTYDLLQDLLDIKKRRFMVEQGGEIRNSSSYDILMQDQENIINSQSVSEKNRRTAIKRLGDLKIEQLKLTLSEKKKIDSGDLRQYIEQDLTELSYEFPDNPISYSRWALLKWKEMVEGTEGGFGGLNNLIDTLDRNEVDTTDLNNFLKEATDEINKYAAVTNAFDTGDYSILDEYAVVHSPYDGKTRKMDIIEKGKVNKNYQQFTNVKFVNDGEGNLKPTNREQKGLQLFFSKANAEDGNEYNFGNNSFEYISGVGFETDKPEEFNLNAVRHASLHSIPSGDFAEDSRKNLYYINQDRSLSPIKREVYKRELNYSEDRVHRLSREEEVNTLSGAITPLPFEALGLTPLSLPNREAEMAESEGFMGWLKEKREKRKDVFATPEGSLPDIIRPVEKVLRFGEKAVKRTAEYMLPKKGEEKRLGEDISKFIRGGREFIEKIKH